MEQGPVPPEPRLSADDTPPPPSPDPLDEQMASTPRYERVAVVVEHFTPATSSPSLDWIAELAVRAERYELSVPEIRKAATDLAWSARVAQQPYPGDAERLAARGLTGSRMGGSCSPTFMGNGFGSTTGSLSYRATATVGWLNSPTTL